MYSRTARVSIVRWNLKEAAGKSLVRRTEITYKARLREISWLKATKSNVCVEFFAECFHTSYLEIVNPPSDELVEFLHFVAVANTLAVRLYISHYLGMFTTFTR